MLRSAALFLAAAALSACGQPQPVEPPSLPPTAEAPPVLLGADPFEPELHAPGSVARPALAQARRPGWGTMEPIPNPPEYAAASNAPPYRLIGPTAAEPPVRTARRTTAATRVAAQTRPASRLDRPRVHHVVMPGRRPAPAS